MRQEDIPADILSEFTEALARFEIPFQHETTERRAFAAIEYLVPTALVLFFAKPFFEGFLKKAGEDAYASTKSAIASMAAKAASLRIRVLTSAPHKVPLESPYSRVISFYSNTKSGERVKFLMPSDVSLEVYERIVHSMLTLMREHFEGDSDDSLSTMLGSNPSRPLRLLHFDFASESWQVMALPYGKQRQ